PRLLRDAPSLVVRLQRQTRRLRAQGVVISGMQLIEQMAGPLALVCAHGAAFTVAIDAPQQREERAQQGAWPWNARRYPPHKNVTLIGLEILLVMRTNRICEIRFRWLRHPRRRSVRVSARKVSMYRHLLFVRSLFYFCTRMW